MSRKYKIRDQEKLYHITFSVIHWLDVFIRRAYSEIFLENLKYCQKHKGLEVYAFCIMSSHIHMIVGRRDEGKIEHIVRDLKKYTSVKIIEAIAENPQESRKELLLWLFEREGRKNKNNTRFQFWQQHSHPIELNTTVMQEQRVNYIHNNPVEAGIVLHAEDYVYSSARNYAGLPDTVLDVILIQ